MAYKGGAQIGKGGGENHMDHRISTWSSARQKYEAGTRKRKFACWTFPRKRLLPVCGDDVGNDVDDGETCDDNGEDDLRVALHCC